MNICNSPGALKALKCPLHNCSQNIIHNNFDEGVFKVSDENWKGNIIAVKGRGGVQFKMKYNS